MSIQFSEGKGRLCRPPVLASVHEVDRSPLAQIRVPMTLSYLKHQEDLEEAQGCGGRKSWSAFWVPPVQGSLPGRRDLRHGFGPSTNHDQHLVLDRFHPLTPRWNLTFLVSRTGSHLHLTAVLEGHVKCSQPEVPDRSDLGLCRPSATVVWFLCSQVTLSVNAPWTSLNPNFKPVSQHRTVQAQSPRFGAG